MATYNPVYWEVQTSSRFLESVPVERSPWYETSEDRACRHAQQDFFASVMPIVRDFVENELTKRQREILTLYFFEGKTQEEIAADLSLTQSTVSRHLFGTVRNGKKVGGAIPKLRKVVDRTDDPEIANALTILHTKYARARQAA